MKSFRQFLKENQNFEDILKQYPKMRLPVTTTRFPGKQGEWVIVNKLGLPGQIVGTDYKPSFVLCLLPDGRIKSTPIKNGIDFVMIGGSQYRLVFKTQKGAEEYLATEDLKIEDLSDNCARLISNARKKDEKKNKAVREAMEMTGFKQISKTRFEHPEYGTVRDMGRGNGVLLSSDSFPALVGKTFFGKVETGMIFLEFMHKLKELGDDWAVSGAVANIFRFDSITRTPTGPYKISHMWHLPSNYRGALIDPNFIVSHLKGEHQYTYKGKEGNMVTMTGPGKYIFLFSTKYGDLDVNQLPKDLIKRIHSVIIDVNGFSIIDCAGLDVSDITIRAWNTPPHISDLTVKNVSTRYISFILPRDHPFIDRLSLEGVNTAEIKIHVNGRNQELYGMNIIKGIGEHEDLLKRTEIHSDSYPETRKKLQAYRDQLLGQALAGGKGDFEDLF